MATATVNGIELVRVGSLRSHPSAGLVPKMRPDEWTAFLADVGRRGVVEPLVVQKGEIILDGRSRHEAAELAELENVPARYVDLPAKEQVDYIIRSALLRRHLNDDQRAILAARFQPELSKAARSEAGKKGGRGKKKQEKLSDNVSDSFSVKKDTRTEAAEKFSVPERKVRAASQVHKADPKLADKVLAGEVTLAQARREHEREQKRSALEAKAKAAEKAAAKSNGEAPWKILRGDCLDQLKTIKDGSVRLCFADPPYNIGIDYGQGKKADKLPDSEFISWCRKWIFACRDKLADDGSLWLMIGDEYADHFGLVLRESGLHRRAWIKWYETFGVNQSNNFNRTSRHIFYCVRDPKRFMFHADAVNRPSDRQAKYNDSRANPAGKIWDDVWVIPRLVGTAKERIPDFPTQLPLELLRAIVGCASEPGDLVLDPFSGSATTGIAAIEAGRKFIGIEKSKQFADLATKRLKGVSL